MDTRSLSVGGVGGLLVGAVLGGSVVFLTTPMIAQTKQVSQTDNASVLENNDTADDQAKHTKKLGAAPRDLAAARSEIAQLRRALDGIKTDLQAAADGDMQKMLDENQRLRGEVQKQQADIEQLRAEQREALGEAVPFPDDLAPRFQEESQLKAMRDALQQAGLDGEITSIDCSEYPCLVWGEINGDTSKLSDAFGKTSAFSPYKDDRMSVHGWSDGKGRETFAISVTPPRPPNQPPSSADEQAAKRRRFRAEQGYEAVRNSR